MRHLNVRRTKSVLATSLSSSVEMLARPRPVPSPLAASFSGRWETVSVGTSAAGGAIVTSLEQRGRVLCPWQGRSHLADHDGERRSYIVLCCFPTMPLPSAGGQVPSQTAYFALQEGRRAPRDGATGYPFSPSRFRVDKSHDPSNPSNPRHPDHTPPSPRPSNATNANPVAATHGGKAWGEFCHANPKL